MFSSKFLWYATNLNLVQIEHVMEQTVKERIMEFIRCEKIPVYRFEKACGISNGYIRSINKTPGADKISKILSAYPNLNPNWLLTGEGSMLIDSDGKEQGIGNITGNKISGVNNVIGSRSVSVHNIDKSATEEMLIKQIDMLMNQISQQEKIIASLTRLLERKVDGEKV